MPYDRRALLRMGLTSSLVGVGGCSLPISEHTNRASPTSAETTPGVTERPATTEPTEIEKPSSFAFIYSRDDTPHQFEFTVTRVETDDRVYELEDTVEPGLENGVVVSDEWLGATGTYRARCVLDRGGDGGIEVDVDDSWTCDNTVDVMITEDGDVYMAILHSDGSLC